MGGSIEVEGLAKRFVRGELQARTLKEVFVQPFRTRASSEWLWALEDVSFTVRPGRLLGILGGNGSGKSTLLRLVGGIGRPTRGTVQRRGTRIHSMLDLGLGFMPDLTGEENAYLSGIIHGLTRREIRARMDSIVRFAELEHAMQSPLRTYSSGMRLRLAFAVVAHCDPEILLVDEVLAVGDLAFQNKCLERMAQFRENGCAIMLVTHDVNLVRRIADDALWLQNGKQRMLGQPVMVADAYEGYMEQLAHVDGPEDVEAPIHAGELTLGTPRLLDLQGQPVVRVPQAGQVVVEMPYRCRKPVEDPWFFVELWRADGAKACSISHPYDGRVERDGTMRIVFERLDLTPADYSVDVGIFAPELSFAYDYKWQGTVLTVYGESGNERPWHPPTRWELSQEGEG